MKKILFLGIMAFMLPFASCNDEDESPDKDDVETLTIDFDGGDVVLDAGEHLFYLTFFCDQNWILSEFPEVSWCTPYTTRGEAGKQEVKVSISKNTTGEKRETELFLNCATGERSLKITQKSEGETGDGDQDPDEPITPVEPEDYDLVADGIYYRVASMEEAALEVTGDGNVYQGDVIIPDEVEYKGKTFKVTVIKAFNNSPVTSVKIGNNVTEIGGFNQCENLTSISIPASVESIHEYPYTRAFVDCPNLSEVILEDGPEPIHIAEYADVFEGTPIKTLHWGRTCSQDSKQGYYFEFATQVTIGDQITTPPSISAPMAEITIPANVTTISYLSASTLIIEDADTDLELGAYAETIYLNRNLINSVSSLECAKSLTIGNKVTSLPEIIGDLESIDISSSVQYIDNITSCPNLRKIICRATTPPPYGEIYFSDDTYFYGTLYVPEEALSLYKETSPWSNFIDIQAIKE